MMRGSSRAYDQAFFARYREEGQQSASVIVPLVNDLLQPKSVLDVGCGPGSWLVEWINISVTDVVGLDGEYIEQSALRIPPASFVPLDLSRRFSLGRKFDLVESLEVAEHLEESCADAFVESLSNHADNVLFSAAIPGQGGTHHVNEQWLSYWVTKFARRGFRPCDVIRPVVWTDRRVLVWYRQNTVLFSKNAPEGVPDTCLDVVHPELWSSLTRHQVARRFRAALTNAIRLPLAKLR
jgi:SAM-dependent methyltransferase